MPIPPAIRIVRLTTRPIDDSTLIRRVAHPSCGAVAVFLGTVRNTNDGKPVRGIIYEAYPELAIKALKEIGADIEREFGVSRYAIVHRIGQMKVGEVSVAIVVAAPHRDEAFKAARFVIEAIKVRVPIWKKEIYAHGKPAWVRGTPLQPPK